MSLQSNNNSITTIPHCKRIAHNNTTATYKTVPYLIGCSVRQPSYAGPSKRCTQCPQPKEDVNTIICWVSSIHPHFWSNPNPTGHPPQTLGDPGAVKPDTCPRPCTHAHTRPCPFVVLTGSAEVLRKAVSGLPSLKTCRPGPVVWWLCPDLVHRVLDCAPLPVCL